jgi:hypothetical protein
MILLAVADGAAALLAAYRAMPNRLHQTMVSGRQGINQGWMETMWLLSDSVVNIKDTHLAIRAHRPRVT